MVSLTRKKFILLGLFFLLSGNLCFSQNPQSYFYENELDLLFPIEGKWFMNVGLGNRGLLQERLDGEKISGYQHEHVELNHFTIYIAKETLELSLGLRYRFKELFDPSETDEFRIIEQIGLEPANSPLAHRFRLEQRFREHTAHRIRYRLGYSKPINNNFSYGVGTETLYAVSAHSKPEAEQRFLINLENESFDNIELELSFNYRIEDYTNDLEHEFFIITEINLYLD